MQYGADKKLQPSEISELERRGMITFAGRGGNPLGYTVSPYILDKSGSQLGHGAKTRNQGTLYGERTSDGGDQGGASQMMPMLGYQDGAMKDGGPYTF
jgi:hypothetical protein